MQLLAVIVNYRTSELTLSSLEALVRQLESEPGECRVVVVDNDSGDGSFERLSKVVRERGWSAWVSVVASPRNGGFGYGNNVGIRPAIESADPPEFVYLLNPDACVQPGAVAALVSFLRQESAAGIVGSVIWDFDARPLVGGFRFPSVASEFENGLRLGLVSKLLARWRIVVPIPTAKREVDWVSGTSMLIRSDVLREVGLFDEGFFLYFEETDLCQRTKQAGWSVWVAPDSRVAHHVSASTHADDARLPRPAYWFTSRRRYFRKHRGTLYLWLANLAWAGGFALWRIRRFLTRRPDTDPPGLLRDFLRDSFGRRGGAAKG